MKITINYTKPEPKRPTLRDVKPGQLFVDGDGNLCRRSLLKGNVVLNITRAKFFPLRPEEQIGPGDPISCNDGCYSLCNSVNSILPEDTTLTVNVPGPEPR